MRDSSTASIHPYPFPDLIPAAPSLPMSSLDCSRVRYEAWSNITKGEYNNLFSTAEERLRSAAIEVEVSTDDRDADTYGLLDRSAGHDSRGTGQASVHPQATGTALSLAATAADADAPALPADARSTTSEASSDRRTGRRRKKHFATGPSPTDNSAPSVVVMSEDGMPLAMDTLRPRGVGREGREEENLGGIDSGSAVSPARTTSGIFGVLKKRRSGGGHSCCRRS